MLETANINLLDYENFSLLLSVFNSNCQASTSKILIVLSSKNQIRNPELMRGSGVTKELFLSRIVGKK